MPRSLRAIVISARTSSETKARFSVLAARHGLTESALLERLVENVVRSNPGSSACDQIEAAQANGVANERVTLRLRPGDRALADAKAAARRMKTSSYLAMLVRRHVRCAQVMPPAELDQLKILAAHLAALGRELRAVRSQVLTAHSTLCSSADVTLQEVGQTVESARALVADIVRQNLLGWEAGNA